MIASLFIHVFLLTFAAIVIAYFLPDVEMMSTGSAFFAAFVLAVVNALIRPMLPYLQLPQNTQSVVLVTLGCNAVLFNVIAGKLEGFRVQSWFSGIVGTLLITIISVLVCRISV